MEYKFESWFDHEDKNSLIGIDYWNDEAQISQKGYYRSVMDNNIEELETFWKKVGYYSCLMDCIEQLQVEKLNIHGVGIDLAAGSLWTIPHLLKNPAVDHIYALEYSKFCIQKLGVKLLTNYQIPAEKVTLVLGSFYNIKLSNNSLDFIHISAALHHANQPLLLLKEMWRVLKPKGVIIMPTEPFLTELGYIKYRIVDLLPMIIKRKIWQISILPKKQETLSPNIVGYDPVLGDHFYHIKHYDQMFEQSGFKKIYAKYGNFASFVLQKIG